MPASEANISTASANKYLQQLCKHWSHKFPVEFTPDNGRVRFADNRSCDFIATPDALVLRVQAPDDAALQRTQQVVIEHLMRFAFRENLGEVRWTRF
jgi:hypothetical protein